MKSSFVIFLLFSTAAIVAPQAPPPPAVTPSPETTKLSVALKEKLDKFDRSNPIPRNAREAAYKKLLEGQRNLWRMRYQRTQAGRMMFADQARSALVAALE